MKTPNYRSTAAHLLIAAALSCASLQADSSIGVNFAGANVHGTPTRLDRTDLAGVVPGPWNNFHHSATGVLLRDNSGQSPRSRQLLHPGNVRERTTEPGRANANQAA
jgi:hypothetical protein